MSRQTWTDVAVVTVLALAVRAGAVWLTGFDGMYGQDAFAYLRQIRFLAEHGPAAWLQPNAFAWPHAYPFIWPSGYPLAAVLPAWVSGSDIWAGQFTSLLFGSLTPAVLYLVAARMGNRPAGWIAGGVGVVAAFPVQASTVVMADAGGLFWASLALWSVVEARERSRPETWVVLAALAAGAAAITRWAFGLTWPALALFGAYVLVKRRRSLAWLLVGVVPALGLVGIEWWVDSALTSDSLALWHPVHAAQRTFEINSGTFAYTHPMSVYWILALAHPAYLVPPMTVLAGLGAWRLWHTDQPVALLLLGWVVCVYGFLAGMPFQNLRFGLTYFSPAVVLAGVGGAWAMQRFGSRLVGLGIVACLLLQFGWAVRANGSFYQQQNAEKVCAAEFAAQVPAGAPVFTFGSTLVIEEYTPLDPRELFYETEAAVRDATRRPGYAVLNLENLQAQWVSLPMGEKVTLLSESQGFDAITSCGAYTLYQWGR